MPACATFLKKCAAYDRARGNFKLRRALYAQIVDVRASVADAAEGKAPASPDVLTQFNAISDPAERSRFYDRHRVKLIAALDKSNKS
jgi:hypothetical protein